MNRTLFRVFTITTAVLVGCENLSLAIDPPSESPAAPPPVAKDEIVTQILPLRYGEAAKLVESLRPLLADSARISVSEGTNSLILTDTQANIRRVSAIIQAIDTSVASVSTIKVIPLRFALAKDLATVITQLFTAPTANQNQRRGGGFGGGRGQQQASGSEARQAVSRVAAVADDQTNTLIVCATEATVAEATKIVAKLDIVEFSGGTDTRIFRLKYGDASEMAELLTGLYADTISTQNANRRQGVGQGGGGQQPQQSQRVSLQSKVAAFGDTRTNSLVVTSARETMAEIAEMVGRLDATDAKKQRVFVEQRDVQFQGEPVQATSYRQYPPGDYPTPLEKSRMIIPPSNRVRE